MVLETILIKLFHIGNKNLDVNIPHIGYGWIPATPNEFLKIEFKFPQYISKIEILRSYTTYAAIDTADYDIEFNDEIIKAYHFKSNGKFSPIDISLMASFSWDQNVMDSQFTELQFDKSKQIYDTKIGYTETLDTNNFRNIPINGVEKLKSLCINPLNTHLNCLISFDKKQTWKTFNGTKWIAIADISPENIILNGMEISGLNQLDKDKLIAGGFIGDLDFKIAMKTNDENETPSVTKIYIEYT